MRARRVAALLCAVGLLTACTQEEPAVSQDNYPPELAEAVVPAATIAPTDFTLAAPVEAYSIAWGRALNDLHFDAVVGVAALAEDEE